MSPTRLSRPLACTSLSQLGCRWSVSRVEARLKSEWRLFTSPISKLVSSTYGRTLHSCVSDSVERYRGRFGAKYILYSLDFVIVTNIWHSILPKVALVPRLFHVASTCILGLDQGASSATPETERKSIATANDHRVCIVAISSVLRRAGSSVEFVAFVGRPSRNLREAETCFFDQRPSMRSRHSDVFHTPPRAQLLVLHLDLDTSVVNKSEACV